MRLVPAVCLAILGAACSAKNGATSGGQTGSGVAGACDAVSSQVRALYEAEPVDDKVTPETRTDLVAANVHMILSDCETAPESFMACIRKAKTIADLEKNCTIPLDDEGTVEGRQFK